MFYSTLFVAATALTGFASAQNSTSSGGASSTSSGQPGQYSIDPNSVDFAERQSWCTAQRNTCRQVCGGQAFPNDCDANTLTIQCTCAGNSDIEGESPDLAQYQQSLAAYICRADQAQCITASGDDLDQQNICNDRECGDESTSSSTTTSSSSGSSSTASSTGSGSSTSQTSSSGSGSSSSDSDSDSDSDLDSDSSDSDSDSSSATTSSSAADASNTDSGASGLLLAQSYGTGVIATGLLAVFGLAL